MQKILHLEFIPRSADLALLVLRLWLGLSMAFLHGWGKVAALAAGKNMFDRSMLGLGAWPEFVLVTFAEFVCALLVAIGLWTRLASFFMVVTMAVAFFMAHGMTLRGPMSGEVAYLYLAGYLALLIAGAGKFSFDKK
ncbi:MAG: DoxX family protein [Opitutae bacterium]|nr:DoxX family protein [Opitutae bacterium]